MSVLLPEIPQDVDANIVNAYAWGSLEVKLENNAPALLAMAEARIAGIKYARDSVRARAAIATVAADDDADAFDRVFVR